MTIVSVDAVPICLHVPLSGKDEDSRPVVYAAIGRTVQEVILPLQILTAHLWAL